MRRAHESRTVEDRRNLPHDTSDKLEFLQHDLEPLPEAEQRQSVRQTGENSSYA